MYLFWWGRLVLSWLCVVGWVFCWRFWWSCRFGWLDMVVGDSLICWFSLWCCCLGIGFVCRLEIGGLWLGCWRGWVFRFRLWGCLFFLFGRCYVYDVILWYSCLLCCCWLLYCVCYFWFMDIRLYLFCGWDGCWVVGLLLWLFLYIGVGSCWNFCGWCLGVSRLVLRWCCLLTWWVVIFMLWWEVYFFVRIVWLYLCGSFDFSFGSSWWWKVLFWFWLWWSCSLISWMVIVWCIDWNMEMWVWVIGFWLGWWLWLWSLLLRFFLLWVFLFCFVVVRVGFVDLLWIGWLWLGCFGCWWLCLLRFVILFWRSWFVDFWYWFVFVMMWFGRLVDFVWLLIWCCCLGFVLCWIFYVLVRGLGMFIWWCWLWRVRWLWWWCWLLFVESFCGIGFISWLVVLS